MIKVPVLSGIIDRRILVNYRVRADVLRREFKRCDTLHRLLLQYTNALLIQIAQTAVCNKFHSVEERFCRWLLMAHDRLNGDDLPLTHEFLALMLGVRRAGVTTALQRLESEGLVVARRGAIFAPIMFVVVYELQKKSHRSAVDALYQTALLFLFFVPFSYLMDRAMYRAYQRKTGTASPPKKQG